MIYQIYGFNVVCDWYIEALQEYISKDTDKELPTIYVSYVDKLVNDADCSFEMSGEYAKGRFSNEICKFDLIDDVKIRIDKNSILLNGEGIHSKRVGEELNGPSIIAVSRFNRRAVLHGSAFEYKGKAYLIIAYPGAGKSTLTTAMVKYQSDISFLTDDIICVAEDGEKIFNGIHVVNLNDDSMDGLQMTSDGHQKINAFQNVNSVKNECEMDLPQYERCNNMLPLGGIIFLSTPINKGLINIEEVNNVQSFYSIMKNIKMRKILTDELLVQEMNIVNRMISKDVFSIELHIEHDYAKLEVITKRLKEFIDGYNRRNKK